MIIEELMEKLNTKGKITDKETAIQLLTISPKAWELLSPELKKDEEVLLYYQPECYFVKEEWISGGTIYYPTSVELFCDKRFELDAKLKLGPADDMYCLQYIGPKIDIYSMAPSYVLKKNNLFRKAYINIQKGMKVSLNKEVEDRGYCDRDKEYGEMNNSLKTMNHLERYARFGECEIRESESDGSLSRISTYKFDRSNLEGLVNNEYEKYLSLKRR